MFSKVHTEFIQTPTSSICQSGAITRKRTSSISWLMSAGTVVQNIPSSHFGNSNYCGRVQQPYENGRTITKQRLQQTKSVPLPMANSQVNGHVDSASNESNGGEVSLSILLNDCLLMLLYSFSRY